MNKATRHQCERPAKIRLLCSDLAQLLWVGPEGSPHREIAILENLSRAGVGLFMGVAVAKGTEVHLLVKESRLAGQVTQCVFRENGYIVGLELDAKSQETQAQKSHFLPEHLLDLSLLELK